jgi:para-nitrobenzyl esterase
MAQSAHSATPAVAACLRALPAATVESLAGNGIAYDDDGDTGSSATENESITDGQILPLPAYEQYETGNFNHVPMIIGGTEDEGEFFIISTEYYESPRAPLTAAQFEAAVTGTFSGNAGPGSGGSPPAYPAGTVATVMAHYPVSAYPSAQLAWGAESGDSSQVCRDRHIAQILANQVPLYAYEFRDETAPDYYPPLPGFLTLAYHTADIAYYFPLYHGGPLGITHPLNAAQENLSDQLVAAWTNFAWTGNPNGASNSNRPWPRYTFNNGLFFAENLPPLVCRRRPTLSSQPNISVISGIACWCTSQPHHPDTAT